MNDMSDPLLTALKALASQTGKILPKAKQLYSENRAARGKIRSDANLLPRKVSEIIGRIIGNPKDTVWWKAAFQKFECRIVAPPELFEGLAVKEWLSDKNVQKLFSEIVSANLTGSSKDLLPPKKNLAKKYSDRTGEREEYASYRIEIIVNVIIASILSPLRSDLSAQALSILIQEEGHEIRGKVDENGKKIVENVSREISALHKNQDAAQNLGKIKTTEYGNTLKTLLGRRRFKDEEVLKDISTLANEVINDDYAAFIDPSLKANILFYASLWHCDKDTTLNKTDEYLNQLKTLNSKKDLRRIEAARLHCQGETKKAIKILDRVRTPEATAQLFAYFHIQKGPEAALEWIGGSDHFSFDLMVDWGWENVAIAMAEVSRWHDALDLLVRYQSENRETATGIPFLEGMLRIGLTIAKDYRLKVIKGEMFPAKESIIAGPEVPGHRTKALECFDLVERMAQKYEFKSGERGAQFWKAWLLLTEDTTEKKGIEFIQGRLESQDPDLGLLDLAVRFGVDFNPSSIQESLRRRELTGTLGPDDLFVKLTLMQHQRETKKIVIFLKQEKDQLIGSVLNRASWASLLIENLISEAELAQAEAVLGEEAEYLKDDAERFKIILAAKKGSDASKLVFQRYETSGDMIDLINLCKHLEQKKDYSTLKIYAQKAFERQNNVDNALRITRCMMNLTLFQDVVSFLDLHPEILNKNEALQSIKAWALFYLGRFNEAASIADSLFHEKSKENITELRANIAFFSGRWREMRGIVDHDLNRSEFYSATHILLMAKMISNADRDLSITLLKKAVNTSPEDVQILSSAGLMAIHLGKDDVGFPWIGKAMALSSPEGPFKSYELRQMKDFLRRAHEKFETRQSFLRHGKVSWHLFCHHSNMPLCRPLVALVLDNQEEKDIRRKPFLPIRHGVREDLDLKNVQHLAMDMTALLLSETFDIFQKVLDSFQNIYIPWETMSILFEEERSVRFCQPTQIKQAKHLLELIRKIPISTVSNIPTTPSWLIREVGKESAELLQLAKEKKGRFILIQPMYRAGSLLMEKADLKEYAPLLAPPEHFVTAMYDEGCLSKGEMEGAIKRLPSFEMENQINSNHMGQGPIYLSPLALEKLNGAGVLSKAKKFQECFIHKETKLELSGLSEVDWQEDTIIQVLERLRKKLRDGLKSGKICCKSRIDEADEHIGEFMGVLSLLKDFAPADAVWVEDRMISKVPRTKDSSGHEALMVGLWDIAKELVLRGHLTIQENYELNYRMRQANLIMIPCDTGELDHWLRSAKIDPDKGKVSESAELRAIRQIYRALISSIYLQLPEEKSYLDQTQRTVICLLEKYWNEDPLDVSVARARSDWLFDSLYTSVIDTRHLLPKDKGIQSWKDIMKFEIARLMALNLENPIQRQEYSKWIDERLLKPLTLSNVDVQRDLAELVKSNVRKVYHENIDSR
jgi:tetratricopeptide (TPR) repeat protein